MRSTVETISTRLIAVVAAGILAVVGSLMTARHAVADSTTNAVPTKQAFAGTTITGTVGTSGKYLLTPVAVNATAGLLKLSFEDHTAGTNLELCAGTATDFSAGSCATVLSDSGGPGFIFLTIIDAAKLSGKQIFVLRALGTANSQFTLTVD